MTDEEPDVLDFVDALVSLLQSYGFSLDQSRKILDEMIRTRWPQLELAAEIARRHPSVAIN